MAEERAKRRLAAILAADVVGYSVVALMSAFGGKADVITDPSACPLIATSGH